MARERHLFLHSTAGRRGEKIRSRFRGKYTRAKWPQDQSRDLAIEATLRAAVLRMVGEKNSTLDIRPQDFREKIRRYRSPWVMVFVMDNSWSMHVETTIEKTKRVVVELLEDARNHHDKVALVAFRHNRLPEATVCLPLTRSYTLAAKALQRIPISGTTPLPDGLRQALHILRQEKIKYQNAIPVAVIITDGLPNIPLHPGGDPYHDIDLLCLRMRREGIATIIVDIEPTGMAAGRNNCRRMATLSRGRYLTLSSLTRHGLEASLAQNL
ncbi:MAG: VWA domain-containing protein [Deltaproteobacteria bacterium]|nr:VWA domain-containing protein [Deltaproteobacteria bacterium]